ncbi:MAG: hypoxanthine phosphoribosyltransferase [Syntrophorhabdales bacterium]|jgi:hypoxanthine phosphoribosyltransferase
MPNKLGEKLRKLFDEGDIRRTVKRLARAISRDFDEEEIVFVCILKGSFMFMSDLVRELENPVVVDFIRAASYGCGTTTSGEVSLTKDIETDISGRNVILVEDIIDSGLTLRAVRDLLLERKPRSLKICALVDKKARRKVQIEGDYVGFTIEDGFIVGYGIDYGERFRNLPAIFVVEGK